MSSIEERKKIGRQIVKWEARRDPQGRVKVYRLPAGDGGGQYEVAGINDKYHPEKALELKNLVEAGKYEEAENAAAEYIAAYTDRAARWTTVPAVEAFLRDCCFNRGAGGAAKIFQLALKVHVDGDVGNQTMTAARAAELDPRRLLQDLRAARERYERDYAHRSESSQFWNGLVNRWNNALQFSLGMLPADSGGTTGTTNTAPPELKIYSTAEWEAKPPRHTNFAESPAKGIVVHNTENANRAPLSGDAEKAKAFEIARSIQKSHLERQTSSGGFWADTGQNFTISRGGVVMEGRHGSLAAAKAGKVVRGAHANSNEHNTSWFGIELEGHYVHQYAMTAEQWKALVELCARLSVWGNFAAANIKGHKQVSDTDCPGLLVDHLDELKAEVKRRSDEILSQNG